MNRSTHPTGDRHAAGRLGRPTPPAAQRPLRSPAGFTLLEVLIAISIIAILGTIVAIALRTISGTSKERSTRVALENAMSLVVEYENSAKLPNSLKGTFTVNDDAAGQPTIVESTIIAMENLRRVPKNKEMLERMSAGSLAEIPLEDLKMVRDWSAGATYNAGDLVEFPADSGNLYRSTISSNVGNTPGVDSGWSVVALPIMTLADAWGKPIYCCGAGLRLDRAYNATETYQPGHVVRNGGAAYKCIQTATGQPTSNTNYWIQVSGTPQYIKRAKDNRVFWVSGGPDGNILTDDDNIYSFEN